MIRRPGAGPPKALPGHAPRPIGCRHSSNPGARRKRGVRPVSSGSVPSARPNWPWAAPNLLVYAVIRQRSKAWPIRTTVAVLSAEGTIRCGCGTPPAEQSWPAFADISSWSLAWRIPRVDDASSQGRGTLPCECGIRRAAWRSPASAVMRAGSGAWLIRPTAAISSLGRRTRPCACGTQATGSKRPASADMRTGSTAWLTRPTAAESSRGRVTLRFECGMRKRRRTGLHSRTRGWGQERGVLARRMSHRYRIR